MTCSAGPLVQFTNSLMSLYVTGVLTVTPMGYRLAVTTCTSTIYLLGRIAYYVRRCGLLLQIE